MNRPHGNPAKRTMLSVTTVWLVCILNAAVCEDWPQWRGLHRDGKSPETGLLQVWPSDGPELLWQMDGVGEGHASMAVANGVIYTTGIVGESKTGIISAIELSGNLLWQTEYGAEWTGSYPGARSCPTIVANRGYILSGLALLVCFNTTKGEIVWSVNVDERFGGFDPTVGFAESPLVVDGRVICMPGGENASLAALDAATGETVWTTSGFSDQAAYCSPILIERGGLKLIVTVTARSLAGINMETGEVVWREPFDVDAEDPNHSVSPVYEDGRIYITSGHRKGGCMYDLDEDGRSVSSRWMDDTLNTLHGGLVFLGGCVYGSNTGGRWICLNAATGNVMYETRGVGMGSIIYADGMLYCYGEKGTFGLVRAAPDAYTIVSSFEVPGENPHWAHPAIAGGRLYVRHASTIRAYNIRNN